MSFPFDHSRAERTTKVMISAIVDFQKVKASWSLELLACLADTDSY